ncbi:alpha/beta hydrolase [Sporosarcina sp. GW1-11]|uniref:alpha/beta fold hydrolase n=1 Tax=Sporosarcina sp. GW1-11 TaxID=2899126 RepID=UPI00294C88B0|nr:alpha/beta hydrolase [Sporosarcina sp. GW1-11]MDV6377446.1 alpha/beta hydrolase [Sporosarcina sp. GW1-11]
MVQKLVLIPGLNNTAETWDGVKKHLPSTIEAIAVDVPALPVISDIAAELLKELPEQFYVCGFSFGGYVALEMLAQEPERILGISLMGSLTTADSDVQKENRAKSIERAENGEYFEMTEANAPKTFHPDSLENEELLKLRKKIVEDYGAETYIPHVKAMISRQDRTQVLKDAAIPKLLIAGESDKVITAEKIKEVADQVTDAEYTTISHTGHMIPLEQPVVSAEKLASWIGKVSQ